MPAQRGWYAIDRLPHRDEAFLRQSITYRLFDSVPSSVIESKKEELKLLRHPEHTTTPDKTLAWREQRLREFLENYEDAGHGSCFLKNPAVAAIVQENLFHFDGQRYRLIEWCVMPNHVHILIEQFPGTRLQDIVDSWKSYTAKRANAILGRTGEFWMRGFRDRFIRNERHMETVRAYIRANPVKAGLSQTPESWPWSSAGSAGSAASLAATFETSPAPPTPDNPQNPAPGPGALPARQRRDRAQLGRDANTETNSHEK
jgi:REP element-mobilizing transposase RayT